MTQPKTIPEMNCQLLKIKTPHYQVTTKETLSQEKRRNLENLKRIIKTEKTNLPSLRNIQWRKFKTETNKINQILSYISTNFIPS